MKYQNPIIRGFNPDPSICRVGEDFYLVTSSFEYFPGIPVYHSRDLVNWTQIGNCIDRADCLPFDTLKVEQGVWAPTIRYHQGTFYVTATFVGFGNFIISSKDPAKGWSDPIAVQMDGIDPSLLFDDGKVYYCTNARGADDREAISLAQIDVTTGALLSEIRQIWHGASADRPQYLEAPHIYHIREWYYLLAAEGGTRAAHMITAARSRCIWGPYEACPHNPLLTNRYTTDTGVAGSGHGDLVEDAAGNWWCVHLATRPKEDWYSPLGRETFLLPVTWQDAWPVIADGISHIEFDGPLATEQKLLPVWNADLTRIEPQWLFLRRPIMECYTCMDNGVMLKPSAVGLADQAGSPTFMAVRQGDADCMVEAEIVFRPQQDGDEAGLTIYISCNGYYSFSRVRKDGQDYIAIAKAGKRIQTIRLPVQVNQLTFRIDVAKDAYMFSYAVADGAFVLAAQVPVLTYADAGRGFTGTLIGVYAQCICKTTAQVQLSRFTMKTR